MNRTTYEIPAQVLTAIDHVRTYFPDAAMVVFNDMGRWQYMGENYERYVFPDEKDIGPWGDGIDVGILEAASDAAFDDKGHPSVYQAYSTEDYD
jgi:hypothetical protein